MRAAVLHNGLPELSQSKNADTFGRRTSFFSCLKSEDFQQEGFFKSLCFILKV